MESTPSAASGFVGSLRALGDGLVANLQSRLELIALELHEEKYRLVQILFWISAAVFTGAMMLTFASLTLVYAFWETARLAVLGALAALYAAAFVAIALGFRKFLVRQPRPFEATLEELQQDRACIRNES